MSETTGALIDKPAPLRSYTLTKDILRFEGTAPAAYWRRFAMLMTLSVVIATMGLLRNSGAVVIAAMLIAPMMTPILGVAAAFVMGWTRRAIVLFGIVLLAAAAATLLALGLCYIADIPHGILVPDQVEARTDPGTEDLVIALAAGVAGAYVQVNRSEVSLLPGAAIGVSLVPPLSAAGILFYFGDTRDAIDAVLLFATNLGAIILAACIVYVASGATSVLRKGARRARFTTGILFTTVFLVAITIQLGRATYARYQETALEAQLAQKIVDWADPISVEVLRVDVKTDRKIADIWVMVDLPVGAQFRVASIADLMPDKLRQTRLSDRVFAVLGPEYELALRYQTRIAGLITYGSDVVEPAPPVEEITEEE